jgi:hypothetical protein
MSSIPFPDPIKTPKGNRIVLPALGSVRFHKMELPEGKIKCGRVVKRASGWYLCLFIDAQPKVIERTGFGVIGIDGGFKDLLTLSKLEGSPMPSYTDWHSLENLIQNCEVEARGLLELLKSDTGLKHQLVFSVEPLQQDIKVCGERAELQSAMSNLISNALRYTPAGGEVRVVSRMNDDGAWSFAVHDAGPGISPEHLPRLTERFYRVDRSRSRETGGTGLGLAIVKHVVQRHGGELKIESVLGQGSVFSWQFPKNRIRLTPFSENLVVTTAQAEKVLNADSL